MFISPTTLMKYIKSGVVLSLLGGLCIVVGLQPAQAQNPANAIEASGISIPDDEDAKIVVVEPDDFPLEIGSINRTIENEKEANTIFELQRDAVYWTDSPIFNTDHRLHLRAEEGDGHPPIIRAAVDFGVSDWIIQSTRDVVLEDIFFVGLNENGVPQDNMEHLGSDAVIAIDNCWMVGAHANNIWFEGSHNAIYTTNSIVANAGRNENDQNGRFLDTRGNDQDTIYVENSTFYHLGHAFIRNSGGLAGHKHINHNTVHNLTQYYRVGEAQEAIFTNNIFQNVYTIGEPVDSEGRAFIEIREQPAGMDEHERVLEVSYNNIGYLFEEYKDLIENRDEFHEDVKIEKAPNVSRKYMDPDNDLPVVTYENNIEERVDFADPPELEIYLTWNEQWQKGRDGMPGDQPIEDYDHPMFYDRWEDTSDDPEEGHYTMDLLRDFSYSEELESYRAAQNGYPVGDLNWFPELKQKWIDGEDVSVEEEWEIVADGFRLVGNYPNPFNPATNIVYEVAERGEMSMEVVNILGQTVATMDLGMQSPGRHEVSFDAGNLSSGIYMVRMHQGNEVRTHQITLVK